MEMLNHLFLYVTDFVKYLMILFGFGVTLTNVVLGIVYFVAIIGLITLNVIIILWIERRVASFFQERLGPNRVGPFGLFQSINDAIKLIGKESIIPKEVDRVVYLLAPLFLFTITVMLYVVLPYGKGMSPVNINVGILYFIAISATSTIAILMAGWGSNNKYSLLGGMRTVAQIISYEIPMAFSMIGIVMLNGTLNLTQIVEAQKGVWNIALQPVAFIIFLISALAELNKAPFDMTEAEQEIIAGYHTEYSGMRFALFFMAEYANLFSVSALGVTVFLGGWQGPVFPSWVWFFGKVFAMILLIMWIRWTFPRFRIDKMMNFNWKFLIPVSILNILLTGVGIKAYQYIVMGWR